MTQTATFPDLESLPTVSSTGILYFSPTMGTLTEVDLTTSGSFQSEFYAENLAPSSGSIEGTTSGKLSINVPTGGIPVSIPSVTETFEASAFDGTLDYGGTSGKDLSPVTSRSTPQSTVLTSPADLAAFTGHFRIPISISGHATGSATSADGDISSGFKTLTSASITITYHYIPDLPSLDLPPSTSTVPPASGPTGSANAGGSSGDPTYSSSSGTNSGPIAPTDANGGPEARSTHHRGAPARAREQGLMVTGISFHKRGQASSGGHSRSATDGPSHTVEGRRIHDA